MSHRPGERGQAMVETAIFAVLAILMIFGLLSWIPVHRARTSAIAAAYACAQFLSQSPDPARANKNAREIAWQTLNADWSASMGVEYRVQIVHPSSPGSPGRCEVFFRAPTLFNGILHSINGEWGSEWFLSRSETWKARWK